MSYFIKGSFGIQSVHTYFSFLLMTIPIFFTGVPSVSCAHISTSASLLPTPKVSTRQKVECWSSTVVLSSFLRSEESKESSESFQGLVSSSFYGKNKFVQRPLPHPLNTRSLLSPISKSQTTNFLYMVYYFQCYLSNVENFFKYKSISMFSQIHVNFVSLYHLLHTSVR